ncbi:MAG: 4Fe-4S dicluster domain-containing protein [Proteobacteria bacterium]|nr:4Fe-4S dicluster domain-containing protein [Pseudomonadota bacterium]MBU1737206.1 4Fe-4S dicluster domain-containing protein [Pseudomonadota bacterium]
MVIDLEKCIGCHACAVACKAEWDVPADKGRNWVKRLGPSNTPHGLASTYYPGLCNHCDQPACVAVCPADPVAMTFTEAGTGKTKTMEVAATWKDPFDGTVQIDKERCLGCGACADACPYSARYVNPALGEDGKADKCTFCVERVAAGLEPACVQTCLAGARIFGDLNDPKSEVAKYVKKGAVKMESDAVKIGPNVRYFGNRRDLHLLTESSTPQVMPEASMRRIMMAKMLRPLTKKAGTKNGLLGILTG